MSGDKINLDVAFSREQQAAIVGHCFLSEEFFLKCKSYVKPEWLSADIFVSHAYGELIKFYDRYKMMPKSFEEFLSEPFFQAQNKQDFEKYKNALMLCANVCGKFSLDILRPKIGFFVKTQKAREQAKLLVHDLNRHNYESGVQAAQEIVKAWSQIDFESTPYVDFSDTVSLWTKNQGVDSEESFSTGSKTLDDLIGGGLFYGGNLAVLAPTFTGKSRFLITLARHALVQGKKVLYMIHEDNPEKVKRRMIASLCGIGPNEINMILNKRIRDINLKNTDWCITHWTDQDVNDFYNFTISELEAAKKLLMENMIFLPWQKSANMFVEGVIEEIKRVYLEQKSKTGRGFDLLIDDYPALLRSKIRHEHERARLSYVYQCFNDLAAELNVVSAYAVQINRSAAKSMKESETARILGLEDISESYNIGMNAMTAISLNRTPSDIENNILRIGIAKSRDNQANRVYITRSAYNEVNLFGDCSMYQKIGRMMIKGLRCFIEPYGTSGSGADQSLRDLEAQIPQAELPIISSAPLIVKKIKGIQLVSDAAPTEAKESSLTPPVEWKLGNSEASKSDSQNATKIEDDGPIWKLGGGIKN